MLNTAFGTDVVTRDEENRQLVRMPRSPDSPALLSREQVAKRFGVDSVGRNERHALTLNRPGAHGLRIRKLESEPAPSSAEAQKDKGEVHRYCQGPWRDGGGWQPVDEPVPPGRQEVRPPQHRCPPGYAPEAHAV